MSTDDAPITKKDLAEALGGLEGRIGGLEGRIGGLEGQIGGLEGQIGGLEGRIGGLEERISGALKELREYIDERTHDMETRLLRAFADYTQAQQVRFQKLSADVGNINTSTDQRLAMAEERLTKLEMRLIAKGI